MDASAVRRDDKRFYVDLDGQTALIAYRLSQGVVTFTHSEVPKSFEGHGVAGTMAKVALDWARAEGFKVVPQCPFVAAYIKKHPEYADLVAQK